MIDLAILGLLEGEDLHGYELKKQLTELLGPWSSVSFGSLYPALARLEKAGHVRAVASGDTPRLTMPMTGALSGEVAAFRNRRAATRGRRNRKVYAITASGREHLRHLLVDPVPASRKLGDDRGFALRVAFCRHLPAEQRLALFEERRTELRRRLDERTDSGRADGYLRSLRERDTRALRHDIEWLDDLIAAERRSLDDTTNEPARAG